MTLLIGLFSMVDTIVDEDTLVDEDIDTLMAKR